MRRTPVVIAGGLVLVVAVVFSEMAAAGSDKTPGSIGSAPTSGFVYGTKDVTSLTYSCKRTGYDSLDCEFIQSRVSKKAKAEELSAELENARKLFREESDQKLPAEDCALYKKLLGAFEGREKPPKGQEKLNQMAGFEKQDMIASIRALLKFCDTPSEENYLDIVKLKHSKEARTCTVGSNSFTQKFKGVTGHSSGKTVWVVKGEPSGVCGIVQLSRFEPGEYLDNGSVLFWNYRSAKAITNPEADFAPRLKCKDLDQDEYLFDWKSEERALGCDYIEFGF